MSKLDELLQGVDVEWRVFGDIASIKRGASPRPIAKFITDDENGVPWIKIGDTSPNSKYVENTLQKITAEGSKKSRLLKKGDFIISNSMSFGRPYILNIDGAIHDGWASVSDFSHTLSADYLYHYLSSSIVQNYWISKINSGSVSNLNADIIKSLQIPIPCPDNPEKSLEIQLEIVRVLDELTSLTNQLKTELETERQNRKKQFEFFREQLFSFEDGKAVWYKLDEVSIKISSGGTPKTSMPNYYNGNIPWLRTQEVGNGEIWDTDIKITELGLKNSSAKYIPINSIIIAMYGATVGKVGINKIPLTTNQACANIEVNPEILFYKFLYYFLKSKYQYIKSLGTGPQTNINAGIVKSLLIPIPSLEEQERIVKLLDQLDATHTAIEDEITKEIKLRTQQYEYYREKLLSFPQN